MQQEPLKKLPSSFERAEDFLSPTERFDLIADLLAGIALSSEKADDARNGA